MTNKQAIEWLLENVNCKCIGSACKHFVIGEYCGGICQEVMEMAIKALDQENDSEND